MVSIMSVSSQETVAKIVNITYPKVVPEAKLFNLTVSIQNLGNTTEMFVVKIVRLLFLSFSIQKEVNIPERSIGNVTFELKLLLSGDLRIEVLLENQLMDSNSFFIEVPTPETDIGLLMIEFIQAEITVIGVTLAALAIFATIYIQARHKWLVQDFELNEKLKKLERKGSEKEKRIVRCASFLLQGNYSECLKYFLDISLVREKLSKTENLEKRETIRSHFENIKKSTSGIAFVLLVAVAYGFLFFTAFPRIIDAILFLYPNFGGRDILLQFCFFPLSFILLFGVFHIVYLNYWSQIGKFQRLLLIALYAVCFFVCTAFYYIAVLLGFLLGVGSYIAIYLVRRYLKKQKTEVLFRKEATQIKKLKEDLRKLHEQSSAKFDKEEQELRQRFNKQLDHFEFAFKLIKENITSKLQRIKAERSFDLVSEKRYQKLCNYFNSTARDAQTLISEISTKNDFNRNSR